ncbi:hypothetical protein BH09ACT8_BH09ACT8_18790 [soil metagenome]
MTDEFTLEPCRSFQSDIFDEAPTVCQQTSSGVNHAGYVSFHQLHPVAENESRLVKLPARSSISLPQIFSSRCGLADGQSNCIQAANPAIQHA